MQNNIQFFRSFLLLILVILIISCNSNEKEKATSDVTTKVNSEKVSVIPEVAVVEIRNENIGSRIELTGRLKALRSITVKSEVQGKVLRQKKELEVGVTFRAGETLARIERTQSDLNLYANRAKFNTQIINLLSDLEADHPEVYPKWKGYT